MEDDTPISEILFDMEVTLCERFPSYTPTSLRKEKAREVFKLIKRLNKYNRNKDKKEQPKVIRRRAGDNWF